MRRYAVSARDSVLSTVQLLASASEQVSYERGVPLASVPAELAEAAEDLYQPKRRDYVEAFTADELRDLAHLYGLVREAAPGTVTTVAELQKQSGWRRVMAVAKDLAARLAVP